MRHLKKKNRISRNTSLRKATLKCLANDLFTYQRIETTKAKAKALQSFAEPMITMAKKNPDSVSARRQAYRKLCDRAVVKSLFEELAPLFRDIPGGYTRIMPLGVRKGDGAETVIIELTQRTISDEKLLGNDESLDEKGKKKVKKDVKKTSKKSEKKTTGSSSAKKGKPHAAPEISEEEKEERAVEDVKKSKAKSEEKKVAGKGILKRFRRKSN